MTTTRATAIDPKVEAWLDARADERLESYKAFLRIPSISAFPEHAADCRRAAEWIADDLRRIGVDHVEVADTSGHPVVYGDWLRAADAPTALVYCHYDVQPVDPLDLWQSPPFEPAVVDGRMLARGASDDKGQIHMHLRAAEALLATRRALPINVKFVFEGDEESSAAPLERWLVANRDRLAADVAVISDTGFFEGNIPAITVGLRGLMYAQIDVVGTSVAFPIKGTEFYERVANRVIPNENWSSRNQNKLLFKGKYPRLYYWFAARWLVKEVNVDKMWRMPNRPYMKIAVESAKLIVARLGVALVDAASFRRTHPKKLAPSQHHA